MYVNEKSAGEGRVLQFCSRITHERGERMKKMYVRKEKIKLYYFTLNNRVVDQWFSDCKRPRPPKSIRNYYYFMYL